MREIELSGSVGPGWPTPNSWERRRRRRRRFKYFVILSEITVTPRKTAYLLLIGAGCLFASSFTKMMELLFFS